MSNSDINSLWRARMQSALGELSSNTMFLEIEREQLLQKIATDAAVIEALKKRVQTLEADRDKPPTAMRARKSKHVPHAS